MLPDGGAGGLTATTIKITNQTPPNVSTPLAPGSYRLEGTAYETNDPDNKFSAMAPFSIVAGHVAVVALIYTANGRPIDRSTPLITGFTMSATEISTSQALTVSATVSIPLKLDRTPGAGSIMSSLRCFDSATAAEVTVAEPTLSPEAAVAAQPDAGNAANILDLGTMTWGIVTPTSPVNFSCTFIAKLSDTHTLLSSTESFTFTNGKGAVSTNISFDPGPTLASLRLVKTLEVGDSLKSITRIGPDTVRQSETLTLEIVTTQSPIGDAGAVHTYTVALAANTGCNGLGIAPTPTITGNPTVGHTARFSASFTNAVPSTPGKCLITITTADQLNARLITVYSIPTGPSPLATSVTAMATLHSIRLDWRALANVALNPDGGTSPGAKVRRSLGIPAEIPPTWADLTGGLFQSISTFTSTGLEPNTSYSFEITVLDGQGREAVILTTVSTLPGFRVFTAGPIDGDHKNYDSLAAHGINGADSLCLTTAELLGINIGTHKALLTDTNITAGGHREKGLTGWPVGTTERYFLVSSNADPNRFVGRELAATGGILNLAHLLATPVATGSTVWLGTLNSDWQSDTALKNCNGWESESSSMNGRVATSNGDGGVLITERACNTEQHIVCVETD